MEKINKDLIAACGINCGICRAHLRPNNPCSCCTDIRPDSPKTRVLCLIRTCKERLGQYCFDCAKFPCEKLKHLDKRYREKYGISEIENLKFIRDKGMDKFIESEREKWQSSKGILCVHDKKYYL
jgi:hypothetical protein